MLKAIMYHCFLGWLCTIFVNKIYYHRSIIMNELSAFNRFTSELKENDQLMPVLFIGHGSPMNGIEDNLFSRRWKQLAKEIPVPKAVLVISAHWLSKGTRITAM
ncbi:MAG TPA: hypothetical protein VNS32_00745, partial [Flavisolibacter sp.]|nr:hypothetical protein [Flavisolibacter sp.]